MTKCGKNDIITKKSSVQVTWVRKMGTIIKRKNKSGTYYYYVESARVNGKPRIVKQEYLGTAEKIAEIIKEKQKKQKKMI